MTENEPPSITQLVDTFLTAQREQHMTSSGGMTFRTSVQAFIAAADWLTSEHMPSVVALVTLADKLDVEVTAAMVGQFGVTFRDLRAQAPGGTPEGDDPVARALREAGKS